MGWAISGSMELNLRQIVRKSRSLGHKM